MTIPDNYMFRPLLAIFRLSSGELKALLHIYIYMQLCPLRCFNDYTTQLHVSAPTGHLQVVFKRNEVPTIYIYIYIYIVRTRDGEISTSGFCCVICNFYVKCGGMLWLEAR